MVAFRPRGIPKMAFDAPKSPRFGVPGSGLLHFYPPCQDGVIRIPAAVTGDRLAAVRPEPRPAAPPAVPRVPRAPARPRAERPPPAPPERDAPQRRPYHHPRPALRAVAPPRDGARRKWVRQVAADAVFPRSRPQRLREGRVRTLPPAGGGGVNPGRRARGHQRHSHPASGHDPALGFHPVNLPTSHPTPPLR